MRNLLTINVSDNGEEIFVYGADTDLIMIRPVGDPETVADYVKGEIENLTENK